MEKITCFFNFRSPYGYLGIKKAQERGVKLDYIPVCYLPKELIKFLSTASENEYKRSYLFEDCERLFKEIGIENVSETISKEAWAGWLEHQTMLVNENRLSLVDPQARKYLTEQTEAYFFGDGADQASGYVPPKS